MKLWGGRFRKGENKLMESFNSSLAIDKRLVYEDITGSLSHIKMLIASEILTELEGNKIIEGLNSILSDIENNDLLIKGDYEDIHSFIETNLIERIGETGKKLHTARSRNDQIAVDIRLYAKKKSTEVIEAVELLQNNLKKKADENAAIMPGYTHLQRAQVVTFKHHLMAYFQMVDRDKKRLENAVALMDESPLGCGALAGTTHNINRDFTAKALGFKKPVNNFLDGVSDRDYLLELMSCFSILMMHLSRLSEELILWSTQEFNFIEIDDAYSTGSSIMPQKRNPDSAELIRGKTGRVYGDLFSLLTTMKGLPLAYNKDMQEDKEPFFDSIDTTLSCLEVMASIIDTLEVNKEVMGKSVKNGFLNATDLADYLVKKGVYFRDAHSIVGSIVIFCEDNEKSIEELSLEELKSFSSVIKEDIYEYLDYQKSMNKGIKKTLLK
ncbi:argininosuccinate lyase [Halobacillus shinanisalinarum]|uniref:Argininosuccinate lyase n=1 Tax=Halobacillus shinanisalinarum TaxID=2932258 RepID=A0ABY4GVF5_9BACI|nr:argininosuccinate lyase [Halobacillus shinanisalinarum]UOQ91878.1 argininosuccinate lyase [Halobacillus shinanisalinarum]